jgi:hypothetical protein
MRMLNLRVKDRAIHLQRRFAAYAPNPRQIPMVLVPNPNYAPQQPLISKYQPIVSKGKDDGLVVEVVSNIGCTLSD